MLRALVRNEKLLLLLAVVLFVITLAMSYMYIVYATKTSYVIVATCIGLAFIIYLITKYNNELQI